MSVDANIHKNIANAVPQIRRGKVWCKTCRSEQAVNGANALAHGWPKCCGYTMTIDPPETWGFAPEDWRKYHEDNNQ